tara:strand:- start:458 stop:1327 length:870 start_codon:yes stop_codon:yes gene_type:complete
LKSFLVILENSVHKKIFLFLLLFTSHLSSYADDEVLMRMYERLEMVRTQMQQLTEENQQLNNKIINLQNQQDRLYQDLILKIQELESKLEEQGNKNKKKLNKNSEKINNLNESSQNRSNLNLEDDVIAKKKDIIPQDENELDLAKPYVNNDFLNNLSFYEEKTEIELYRNAFQLVKDKKYNDAEDAFNAFLYLFPESNYAANAQYWLSESIYALNDFTNAMVNFARVVEKYPNSSKVADAKLKIGYCYYSIKKWKEARFIFSSIAKDYPNTSLSQLAEKKIKSMDVEGR